MNGIGSRVSFLKKDLLGINMVINGY